MTDDVDIVHEPAPGRHVSWFAAFAWLVRRELWEHPSAWAAPLVIGAFAVVIHFVTAMTSVDIARTAALAATGEGQFMTHYSAAIGAIVIVSLIVGILYSLDTLQGERRDRSILFWKSLPVSDLATVLAKAAIPLLVIPALILVASVAANALMVPVESLAWAIRGYDPAMLWARLDLPYLWSALAIGLPFMALWYAPFFAWFMLAAAWARRAPILWALSPFILILMVEHLALHNTPAHWALERRIAGGILEPYTLPGQGEKVVWVPTGGEIDWGRVYSLPDLWVGVAMAALFLFVASRLRRARPPL